MKLIIKNLTVYCCFAVVLFALNTSAVAKKNRVTFLHQSDFTDGTYIINEPGVYRLAEDISFNPHAPGTLGEDGVTVLDAYSAGNPFPSQYGDIDDGKYDPAAFGLGFFAAIMISADNVVLDLNGHTLEQSEEHALLQRFFSLIELADQPFIPGQGPAGFGDEITCAQNVWIKNGTLGRSAHHGIHGNGNVNIWITNVDFIDFEVAAVAMNGVDGLTIAHCSAISRADVPIIGTFSNARFISQYVDWLVDSGSTTTLTVQGVTLTATDIRDALRTAINNVHDDVIVQGYGIIDNVAHPAEYALFHNKHGIIDGNAYGFLVNSPGVAVNGFPVQPESPSKNIVIRDVHVLSQRACVTEVVALKQNGKVVLDPVGAVFMVKNHHPDTAAQITVSSWDDSVATYTGNALANAQALVAKAKLNGEFPSFLDTSRSSITQELVDWIETGTALSTVTAAPNGYLCNGDTMFHVNKGVIGFKIDGAKNVVLQNTSARNLENIGDVGSEFCGMYEISHPNATLPGYGGAKVRGYTFAGSKNVLVNNSDAYNLKSYAGTVVGFDILTDSEKIALNNARVMGIEAGLSYVANGGPNDAPDAIGVHVGDDTDKVFVRRLKTASFVAYDEKKKIDDESNEAVIVPKNPQWWF